MLDLVPLAHAGREVADADCDAVLVGEALQLALPHTRERYPLLPRASAVTKISRASGYRFKPTCFHHASIEVTANTGVS